MNISLKISKEFLPARHIDIMPYSFIIRNQSITVLEFRKNGIGIFMQPNNREWVFNESAKELTSIALSITFPYECRMEVSDQNYRECYQSLNATLQITGTYERT